MELRKCSLCKKELELSSKNFYKNKYEIGGFDYRCKQCKLTYYQNNKEKSKKNSKNWQINNPNKFKSINKKYRQSEKGISTRKKYRKKEYTQKYNKDIKWTLSRNIRIRLNQALKNNFKSGKTLELLGCPLTELKLYLEQQFLPEMTWENHGEIWEIDHTKPCASFDLTDIEQQKECFHYTNLQPLFKTTEIAESLGYKNYIGNRNKINKKPLNEL
jgi:hypothetical protein